jgi:hypothetical protein
MDPVPTGVDRIEKRSPEPAERTDQTPTKAKGGSAALAQHKMRAGLDDVRTLESAKIAAQRWLHEVGTLVAQKDPELLKTLERIEGLEAMFTAAPPEDRLAA